MVSWVMLSEECSPCCDSLANEGGRVGRVSVFIATQNIVPYQQLTCACRGLDKRSLSAQ